MKKNPKMFYSIVNKQKNRKNEVGPFKEDGEIIDDAETIVERLLMEFKSQFSKTGGGERKEIFQNEELGDLNDIEVMEKDIEDAIDELDENSAAGPDGIPAKLLNKIKKGIRKPMSKMLRKSIEEGNIPEIFKLAYITPIHKRGTRQKPGQYTPVSLTSHVRGHSNIM